MASSLSWLDYSDGERQKVLDIIDRFKDRDTRDELGLAGVRDAFAELFSPGTSTIQTRARYFLLIPWIYRGVERSRSSTDAWWRARQAEVKLINVLAESDDNEGTIGIDARQNLKRLPSGVYWQGLYRWGIRLLPWSVSHYHRWIDSGGPGRAAAARDDDEDVVSGAIEMWHRGLPDEPPDLWESASFRLDHDEAQYLVERVLMAAPKTLLGFLLTAHRWDSYVDFPWEHPYSADFPAHIKEQLHHARLFSELMHGAPLLYNLMLAELVGNDEWVEDYRGRLSGWEDRVGDLRDELSSWEVERLWELAVEGGYQAPIPTRDFFIDWRTEALDSDSQTASSDTARRLILEREVRIKGGQARLTNERARGLWGGEAGTGQLNYRWGITQRHVADILSGLEGNDA